MRYEISMLEKWSDQGMKGSHYFSALVSRVCLVYVLLLLVLYTSPITVA